MCPAGLGSRLLRRQGLQEPESLLPGEASSGWGPTPGPLSHLPFKTEAEVMAAVFLGCGGQRVSG